jgi:IS30 family transposase
VTSLLERTSRFTLLPPNGDRRSAAVLAGVAGALRPLPEDARRAITFGRGRGSAGYAALDRHPNLASYFCDPRSPRQKGGVENANGRVRRFLPRHCGPEALGRAHLRRLSGRLNETPRRCPSYRTPREVFEEYLAGPAARP